MIKKSVARSCYNSRVPKVVDNEARRAEIVAALWRVVQRDGMAATSVRTVAHEAGLSAGAMRHYFATQDSLVLVAAKTMVAEVGRRLEARIAVLPPGAPSQDSLLGILEEVTPLDARRRVEYEVWLELVLLARTTPGLHPVAVYAHRGLRALCRLVVMAATGDLRTAAQGERDPVVRRRTDQLHGMLDGLCLHLALYPGEVSRTRVRAALREWLEAIFLTGSRSAPALPDVVGGPDVTGVER